jgi:hypothetical protein
MPGLIEALGGSTGDPNKDAAINQGILQMGLQMLQSRGSFGQALGQGGTAGLQAFNGEQDRQFQQKQRLQQQQVWEDQNRETQRKKQMQDMAGNFRRPGQQEAASGATGAMFPGEMSEGSGSFDVEGYAKALEGMGSYREAMELRSLYAKDNSPLSVTEGTTLLDRKTMKPIFTNPKSDSTAPLSKLIAARDALPVGHPNRALYDQAIQKASTHSPPVTVANYGSPVPVQMPDGSTGLVQTSNRGGPPQILTLPGSKDPLRPAKDPNADKPLTESQAKAAAFLDQMRSASTTLNGVGLDSTKLSGQAQVAAARMPVANAFVSPKAQQAKQAQDQWSESFLRFKTGAAATREEVELNSKTFFPQPGDKPEVVKQKDEARKQAEHSVSIAAGKGADKAAPAGGGKQVKRTGTYQGKKVIEYTDGTVEYQN